MVRRSSTGQGLRRRKAKVSSPAKAPRSPSLKKATEQQLWQEMVDRRGESVLICCSKEGSVSTTWSSSKQAALGLIDISRATILNPIALNLDGEEE